MKIELDDNTSTTITLCVTVLALAATCMYGCHETESTEREVMRAGFEAGLEQVQLEGAPTTRWGREAGAR